MSFDGAEALKVKGVTDVVQVPEGVAVVARGTWAALQGRKALKVQWDESAAASMDTEALLTRYRAPRSATRHDPREAGGHPIRRRPPRLKTVEALYEFPFLAHAPMER